MKGPDPAEALDRLQAFVRPGARPAPPVEGWRPPDFESYEAMKEWLQTWVMSARIYEGYPDGRWTLELTLKDEVPGSSGPRLLRL